MGYIANERPTHSSPPTKKNTKKVFFRLRTKVERGDLSLVDLRNYLFARQALLLLQMRNPEEVARRCLAFIHNTLQVSPSHQPALSLISMSQRCPG
jgi:hypothetical protein